MPDLDKVIKGLECCLHGPMQCEKCPYMSEVGKTVPNCVKTMRTDAISLLKAQDEVIQALRKVGYPHDFQMEEPWIVNYMNNITEVVRKAVRLNNG